MAGTTTPRFGASKLPPICHRLARFGRPARPRGAHRRGARLPGTAGAAGFSLVEVVVAMAILTLVVAAVGTNLDAQVSSMSGSRSRQAAEGLLTKAIAQIQAMPYKDVIQGLSTTDATTATAFITKKGTTWTFADPAEALLGDGEVIPHYQPTAGDTPPPPFYPHATTAVLNGVSFTVSAFPTQYETPPVGTPSHSPAVVTGVYRVTVIVAQGANGPTPPVTLVGQTLVYSAGTNCLSGASNPFAAPCRPNFAATAQTADGQIQVLAAPGAPYPVQGLAFTYLDLILAGTSGSSSFVQTSSVQGWAEASGATLAAGRDQAQVSRVTTGASNDPASPVGRYQALTLLQLASAVSLSGNNPSDAPNLVTASPSPGDSGASVSAASATLATACIDLSGVRQTTTYPCESDSAFQKTTAAVTAHLHAGVTDMGVITLAQVAGQTPSYPDRSFSDRHAPGNGTCPSTPTAVCTTAAAQTSLGTVTLAEFPPTVSGPPGWVNADGLLSLTGYSASATSMSRTQKSGRTKATSTSVPVSGAPTPHLVYWNGSGYTTLALNGTAASPGIPPVSVTDPSFTGGSLTVSMSASVTVGAATTSATTPAGCATACSAYASVAPVTAQITYQIVQGSTVLADLEIRVSLGSVTTRTSYQAPS